ncbi:MAG: hypothetical protein CMD26_06555 [Flavobacteriales bacterium]|nr:hypothetical protein [Flavobacteriales bacterium]|tara:strand:+ start:2993 stop:3406 length:414 start_codon:yes stop_codon:yes gene_type:complete
MLRLQIKNIIKESGLTVTKIRVKVLSVFMQSMKPMTLQSINKLINDLDRVTLFRVLSIFEERKIIHSFVIDHNKCYALCSYECNDDHNCHKHIHFKCDDCHEVSCLSVVSFPQIVAKNHIINNLNINASGKCANCII